MSSPESATNPSPSMVPYNPTSSPSHEYDTQLPSLVEKPSPNENIFIGLFSELKFPYSPILASPPKYIPL